jgi:hypothetical protein
VDGPVLAVDVEERRGAVKARIGAQSMWAAVTGAPG